MLLSFISPFPRALPSFLLNSVRPISGIASYSSRYPATVNRVNIIPASLYKQVVAHLHADLRRRKPLEVENSISSAFIAIIG